MQVSTFVSLEKDSVSKNITDAWFWLMWSTSEAAVCYYLALENNENPVMKRDVEIFVKEDGGLGLNAWYEEASFDKNRVPVNPVTISLEAYSESESKEMCDCLKRVTVEIPVGGKKYKMVAEIEKYSNPGVIGFPECECIANGLFASTSADDLSISAVYAYLTNCVGYESEIPLELMPPEFIDMTNRQYEKSSDGYLVRLSVSNDLN